MAFTYWLPDEQGNTQNHETDSNSVIIIGANGSGKSKLGAWIEKQSFEKVHRISGQRDLNFSKNISLKSHFEAENLVFWGRAWASLEKFDRWNSAITDHYTTTLLHDYEDVLAALIALENYEKEQYFDLCRNAEKNHQVKPETPITAYDKLFRIWDSVLSERKLIIEDARIYAEAQNGEQTIRYSATEMSDGERAVLYLAAQVLCVPPAKILIVDEPELHLHRSIMNCLWTALEQCRPDCLFMYITHDTQFAAAHGHADKIWVKEYDGQNWKLEKIENAELPDELLLNILGGRKNVLFVEGERSSYDTQLYSELYPDYLIIPCGSCTQVIARTKAFRNNPSLHECEVYGIIDRDFRSDYEIEKLAEDHIYTLRVAEVENLFILPCGNVPSNPSELLGSNRYSDLIEELKNSYDLIIIDTPPIMLVTDAALACRVAAQIVMVIEYNKHSIEAIQDGMKQLLKGNNTAHASFVINKYEHGHNDGYGYKYGKY